MSLSISRDVDVIHTEPHWSDYFFFPNIKQKQMDAGDAKDSPYLYSMDGPPHPAMGEVMPQPYYRGQQNLPVGRYKWDNGNMNSAEPTSSEITYKDSKSRKKKAIIFACIGIVLLAVSATAIAVLFHIHLPKEDRTHARRIHKPTKENGTSTNIFHKGSPPKVCGNGSLAIYSSSANCALYINCSATYVYPGLSKYEIECRYPNLFDSETSGCEYFTGVNCGKRYVPKLPCEYKAKLCHNVSQCVPCEDREISCKGLPDGKNGIPLPGEPNRYVVCLLERTIIVKSCSLGLHFDDQSKQCVPTILPESSGSVSFDQVRPVTYIGQSVSVAICTASKISLSQWQSLKIRKVSSSSSDPDIVVWNRDSTVNVNDTAKFTAVQEIMEGGNLRLQLTINNTTCSDEGVYQCVLTTTNGVIMDKTTLTLAANTTDPVLFIPENVEPNSDINVTALWFRGYPPLEGTLNWMYRFSANENFSTLPGDGLTFYTEDVTSGCLVTLRETYATKAAPFWDGIEIQVTVSSVGPGVNDVISNLGGSSGTIRIKL